jgi:hypothetical protein
MQNIRTNIACRAVSAFILLSAVVLGGCGDDDDDKGKVDSATDTSRADGSPDGSKTDGLPPSNVDGGATGTSDTSTVQDFGVADLEIADTVTAADAGVKSACIAGTVCYEYAPDYTDANVAGHCGPQMGTAAAVCPADLMGPRIGRCVTTSMFGTLHTIYYMRVDPRSAQVMCGSKGGTWYAQ